MAGTFASAEPVVVIILLTWPRLRTSLFDLAPIIALIAYYSSFSSFSRFFVTISIIDRLVLYAFFGLLVFNVIIESSNVFVLVPWPPEVLFTTLLCLI